MFENLTRPEYEVLLRNDFATFAALCFQELNPQTELAVNWHLEVIAAKLTAVREGRIRRLIINLPPRHLKSLMASIAFRPGVSASTPRPRSCASAMPRISPTSSPAIAAAS
jgi:hypothetical protein